jgi:hypothetical protein
MENKSLLDLLANLAPKDSGVVLRVPENEKNSIQRLAAQYGLTVSDFIREAIYYFSWATSEIELKPIKINKTPEYIDFVNRATYSVYLRNFLVTDETYNSNEQLTNKHRHSFQFGSLVYQLASGKTEEAILHPDQIVRVFTDSLPQSIPPGVAIWTALNLKVNIWNNFLLEKVSVFRIARKDSNNIIAGIPARNLEGLQLLTQRQ